MRESQMFRTNKILEREQKKYDKKQQLKILFRRRLEQLVKDARTYLYMRSKIEECANEMIKEVSICTNLK